MELRTDASVGTWAAITWVQLFVTVRSGEASAARTLVFCAGSVKSRYALTAIPAKVEGAGIDG